MEPPLQLEIVAFALSRLKNAARESIGALVTDFLVWDMPLSKAVELSHAGSVALLDFVWMRGLRDVGRRRWTVAKLLHREKYYYKWEFSLALAQAICAAGLQMVQWILQHFSGCLVEKVVVEEAARGGHLWALQVLEKDHSHTGIEWGPSCLNLAARHRHWRMVHWLHERTGTPSQDGFRTENNVAECAFEQHNLEELRWATAHGFHVAANRFPDVCSDAERETYWEAIRFLLSRGYGDSGMFVESAIVLAAKVGDPEFVQRLLIIHEDDHGSTEMGLLKASMVAGRYGHVLVLEHLLTRLAELNTRNGPSRVMFEAAKYGKLEVVKWLVERYSGDSGLDLFRERSTCPFAIRTMEPDTVMDVAASHGRLEVLKHLHHVDASQRNKRKQEERQQFPNRGCSRRCTTKAMDLAASNGHLNVVKWLHTNRNEGCTKFAISQAAVNGHLEVVKWLHENNWESCWKNVFDSIACYCYRVSPCCGNFIQPREYYEPNTFITKQLPMIEWLHENHLGSCTTKAMDSAAANGNFELVKWLHENTTAGCTHRAMDAAAARGRLDIVKWLHENRSEGCTAAAMDNAAAGGFLELMKWLRANRSEGCTPKALYAAACGDLKAVQSLVGNTTGTYVSKELQAISHGHLKAVQWLVDHYEGFNITATMERAIICKEPEIVCYLDAQRADRTQSVDEMRARLRNAIPFFMR